MTEAVIDSGPEIRDVSSPMPGVFEFMVDTEVSDADSWAAELTAIWNSGRLIDPAPMQLGTHDLRVALRRGVEVDGELAARDEWAGDHIWHSDLKKYETQPILTGMYCRRAEGDVPGTDILDTSLLLQLAEATSVFNNLRQAGLDIRELQSIFSDSTYYREALPYFLALAKQEGNAETVARIERAIQKTLEDYGASNLKEVAEIVDRKYPPKTYPFVRVNPLTGTEALFFDGGERNSRLIGEHGEDLTETLNDLRGGFLGMRRETLRDLGLLVEIKWEPGKAVVFPQIGTLHRALPGNNNPRELDLAFLC